MTASVSDALNHASSGRFQTFVYDGRALRGSPLFSTSLPARSPIPMSLPTHRLGRLSLEEDMVTGGPGGKATLPAGSPTDTPAEETSSEDGGELESPVVSPRARSARAAEARDILSTWSRNQFPSEIRPDIGDRLEAPRSLAECYQKEDLEASILFAIVHSSDVYESMRQLVPEDRCAEFFEQKLRRRLLAAFHAYDDLAANSPGALDAAERLDRIAGQLRHIMDVARHDRERRPLGEGQTAAHLVFALQGVCSRNISISGERPASRRGTRAQTTGASLFHALLGRPPSSSPPRHGGEPHFGLDVLRLLSDEALAAQRQGLDHVRVMLEANGASPEYLTDFDQIRDRPASTTQGPSRGSDTAASRKRPAGGNGKQGKKRRG